MRVVFDTNTIVSALLFGGQVAWLTDHWRNRVATFLVSQETAGEFLNVLQYPKFGFSEAQIEAFAARYLPFAERIEVPATGLAVPACRDPKDRMFLELALSGHADVLVSGDNDLLASNGRVPFDIDNPAKYGTRF